MPRPHSVLANWSVRTMLQTARIYMRARAHVTHGRGYASRFDMGVHMSNLECTAHETKLCTASPDPGEETPGIRMNEHGSQVGAKVEGGIGEERTGRRRAKMNYGGMRRKMFRASICSRTFPRPLSRGNFRRGFVTIGMQFRKKKRSKNVRRAFARPCFSTQLNLVTFIAA